MNDVYISSLEILTNVFIVAFFSKYIDRTLTVLHQCLLNVNEVADFSQNTQDLKLIVKSVDFPLLLMSLKPLSITMYKHCNSSSISSFFVYHLCS